MTKEPSLTISSPIYKREKIAASTQTQTESFKEISSEGNKLSDLSQRLRDIVQKFIIES